MLVNLVEQDKGFRAMVALIVDEATKGLAERVGGEVVDLQAILSFNPLQLTVDELDGDWRAGGPGVEDVLLFVRAPHQDVQIVESLLYGRVESDNAGLAGLLLGHSKLVAAANNVLPAELENITGPASGAELEACKEFDAVFLVLVELVYQLNVLIVRKNVGCRYLVFLCHTQTFVSLSSANIQK